MLEHVISCEQIADGVFDLRISFETPDAKPGQFLHIKCGDKLLRRPISLCGADGGSARVVFAVKGEGTTWLSGRTAGEPLDVLGPLGNGFPVLDGPTLLVGGGIGVPPLLFASKRLKSCHALLGFQDSSKVCLAGEFESAEIFTNDSSFGSPGYPTARLEELLIDGKWVGVLACGPLPLLRKTAEICKAAGVACYVSMEERMACGVGACLVCACAVGGTYKRVCKDGPVFDAADVEEF